MRFGKLWYFVCGAGIAFSALHLASAQVSTPGTRGPIIQDRMIFYEAALMQFDARSRTLEATLKTREAQILKLEKEVDAAREKTLAVERRVAVLESTLKKVAAGIERGPAPPPAFRD